MSDREFWIIVRQALLLFVDAIEQRYSLTRTAELRQTLTELQRGTKTVV
jgi:hypothetical protein